MSVKCKNCGTMLPDSTFFCTECGTKIETSDKSRVCAKCGAKLREGAIFCVECGTKIGSTNIDNKEGVNQSCNTIVTPKYKKKYCLNQEKSKVLIKICQYKSKES